MRRVLLHSITGSASRGSPAVLDSELVQIKQMPWLRGRSGNDMLSRSLCGELQKLPSSQPAPTSDSCVGCTGQIC